MSLILNIETSTSVCSVALSEGEEVVFEKASFEGPSHAALLGVYMEEALEVAKSKGMKLDAVAVSSGPGSYTGLRIGVSVAKGLCPGCGAAMEFDSTTQKLGCPSCGMQIDVREYEEKYSQNSTQGEYDKEMKMYHCNTCGAELVADEYTSATFCSFCGNPTLVEDRLKGEFKPSTRWGK